jgi:glycosyltransferase involved in cell wall biosynthesis
VKNLTVVIPWDKRYPQWLKIALDSLPEGIPYVLCPNDSKEEMAVQLNDAFQKVETEYVFIMGADDALEPDCLRCLCEAIGTADVAYPSLVDYDVHAQNAIRKVREDPDVGPAMVEAARQAGLDLDEIAPGGVVNEFVNMAEPPSVWRFQDMNYIPGAFLAKTETLRRFPQPELLVEDWAWHFYAMAHGARYVPVPEAKYLYRARYDSLSNRIDQAVDEHYQGDRGGIRRAVRRHVYGDLFTAEGDDPEGRVPVAASFQVSSSQTQAHVRATLPARYLPGVVRWGGYDADNHDRSAAMVVLHPGKFALEYILPNVRAQGRKVIVDVDDDYLSPSLVGWLRKSGMEKLAEQWAKNQPAHREFVKQADAIICATPILAYRYEKLNPNVIVIPNTIDEADWEAPLRIDDGIIRVGWAAGGQHVPDIPLVEPALRWASEQPGVKVCMVGIDPGFDFDYTHYPYTRSPQHYRDLISIFDIGLAPLHSMRMNDGKSDLKWLDYTMAGALTIASHQPAYASVRHGVTGLLAKTPKQFTDNLREALDDPAETMEMIARAREHVLAERAAWRFREIYLAAVGVEPYPIRPVSPQRVTSEGKVVNA